LGGTRAAASGDNHEARTRCLNHREIRIGEGWVGVGEVIKGAMEFDVVQRDPEFAGMVGEMLDLVEHQALEFPGRGLRGEVATETMAKSRVGSDEDPMFLGENQGATHGFVGAGVSAAGNVGHVDERKERFGAGDGFAFAKVAIENEKSPGWSWD
jgi:hypothetical protein